MGGSEIELLVGYYEEIRMEPIRAFLVRTHEVSDFGALVLFLPE